LLFSFVDANSQIEYQETIQTITDQYGMVNLIIGTGNPSGGYAGSWDNMDWSKTSKSLIVELDVTGSCSSFVEISNQPLTAVPYALNSSGSDIPGPQGDEGESAYDVWLSLGNSGTEQEFIDSLIGVDGNSAYQVWLDLGNSGTEEDYIDSLKGDQGETGLLTEGTASGNTTYWDGSKWVIDNNQLYNDGTNVLIGTNVIEQSSALTIQSTNQGILIPRLTLVQRDAISTPATSLLIFQTDNTPGFYYYDGTQWKSLINSSGSGTSSSADTLIYTIDGF